MVGCAHPAAPGCRAGRRTAQGAPLFRPRLGAALLDGRRGALRRVLPAARRRHHRRVDARLPDRLLDAGAAGGRGARGARPHPAARPARALPIQPEPPAGDLAPATRRPRHPGCLPARPVCGAVAARADDAFPAERVFIGQYEACRADPARELARTFAFLGLAPFEPDAAAYRGEVNPTTGPRFEPSASLREALVEAYAPDLEQLPSLAPGLDLSLWTTARGLGLA